MANLSKAKRERLIEFVKRLENKEELLDELPHLKELEVYLKEKKFGLIFEEHSEEVNEMLKDNIPVLTEDIDRVFVQDENFPWSFIIQADNLHALHILKKTHKGKIDCIYIDPPYNSGATDWKYNNDYVDSDDDYVHSKWLSMMKSRLLLARELLNPDSSILILTIDDKEFLHIGCLLEELFPQAKITMISSVINPAGKAKKGGVDFSKTDEYIFFLQIGDCPVLPEIRECEKTPLTWETFRRHSLANARGKHGVGSCGPNQFYPIYVNDYTNKIEKIGMPIMEGVDRFSVEQIAGCTAVFPVRKNGIEMNWGATREEALKRLSKGYLKVGKHCPDEPQAYSIQYLTGGVIKDIDSGKVEIEGYDSNGGVVGYHKVGRAKVPTTNWNKKTHNATSYGTDLINKIFTDQRFDYPKSLYAVRDCLRIFLENKPNALVLDFFAGSGTTLHAVNLLNLEDSGNRRCILVTNNEVSKQEEIQLSKKGFKKGDAEWDNLGIAKHVTWPRSVCAAKGVDINNRPLQGMYLDILDREAFPMSNGFKVNIKFYKAEFISKKDKVYYDYSDELIAHVKELVEIENGICFKENKSIAIILKDDELDVFEEKISKECKVIYLGHDVLPTESQLELFKSRNIKINIIPDYYYQELEG